MVIVTAAMVVVLALGSFHGAIRAGVSAPDARQAARTVVLALCAWLAVVAALAFGGVLSPTARPPRWPLLPLVAFSALVLATRSLQAKRVLSAIPPAWPIVAQTFRVGVELALFALHAAGQAPKQITFEGRNFDVLVGLSAPWVGWLVARGRIGAKGARAWNFLGLAVLANTVVTVATSTPGPLHLGWPGAPFTALTTWPIVWLPAFLMPLAVLLHVVSIRHDRFRPNVRSDRAPRRVRGGRSPVTL
jgi:hypothetical protein